MPKANLLDRAITWVSPRWGLNRTRARTAAEILLSYEGARTDRRTGGWITADTSANAEIGPYLAKLRQRSRDLVRNNAYAANAIDELSGQAIGTGIRARAKLVRPNKRALAQINDAWRIWTEQCDADGQLDFYGLQDLATRNIFEAGEVLIRKRWRKREDNLTVPLQIQVLEPDFIDLHKSEATTTGRIIQGVEFDRLGRRVAYWLYPSHPGDVTAGYSRTSIQSHRVPAEDILHVYRKKRQQVHGVPILAPVIITMRDDDEYTEAALVQKKIQSCFAVFLTQPEGSDMIQLGSTELNASGQLEESLEPGMIKRLAPGEEPKFASPSGTGDGYRDFKRDIQTKMSVGIGLTYEQLTGDLSNVNYSSYRAGLLSFRSKMEQFRWLCFIPMFCNPVARWFAEGAVVGGAINTMDFTMEWAPPSYGSVDPKKDAEAALAKIRSGLMTLPQAIGEEGYDPDEQIAEIKEFNRKLDEAGIVLDSDPRKKAASAGTGQKEEKSDDDKPEKDTADETEENAA